MDKENIKQQFQRSSDNVLVCGNGPSLKEIDYSRLPTDYDVFRCNQFYFEDSYFAGRYVKAAFFTAPMLFYQYLTTRELRKRGEYDIENIIVANFNNALFDKNEAMIEYLIDVIDGYDVFLSLDIELDAKLRAAELYDNQRITSGVYMIVSAVMAGYKNIYLAGLDFYRDDRKGYAFNTNKENLVQLLPDIIVPTSHANSLHSSEFDLDIIQYLINQYSVNIYAICPDSLLTQHVGLAKQRNGIIDEFTVEQKAVNALKDIVLPSELSRKKYHKLQSDKLNKSVISPSQCFQKVLLLQPDKMNKSVISASHKSIYQNIYYHLICDLFYLPRVLKKHLAKKLNKK